jgi:PAS domain S-box-containing protein
VPRSVEELQARLEEAEEVLRAIRSGESDAVVVSGPKGDQIYTLSGAERPYRLMIEAMNEGALILSADATIVYSNRSFATMINAPLDEVIGSPLHRFVLAEDVPQCETLIQHGKRGTGKGEMRLRATGGSIVAVHLSISAFEPAAPGTACAVVTDLTEHKRHQDLISAEGLERTKRTQAEAGRQRIATILESITDSFVAVDREWRITDVNQRAAANLGKTQHELVGNLWWDLLQQGQIPELDELYRKAMAQRVAVHFEGPSAVVQGKWFERHIYPTDEGLTVYFRDITERKQVEEALRAANDRLEMILNSITDRFFAFDDQWRFTYFNKHAEDQLRALGKDPATLIGTVTWEAIPADPELEGVFRRAQSEHISITYEQFYPPLGEWLENRIYPSPDGSVAVFQRCITEVKRAEAELRRSEALLAEGQRMSHTGSWTLNVATKELRWSLEHFRIFGVDPHTFELTLETARQFIHQEDHAPANQTFDMSTAEARHFERDFRIVRPDGTIRYVHSLGHPVFSDTGELTEYVGTIVDVTDRKEEELARQELGRRLVVAQEDERRRIALEMHDEFGQQLSALALQLSALKRERGIRTNLGDQIASLEAIARQLDTDLEVIISRLRPPALDDLGLVAALTNYVKRWSEHFGVYAQLHTSDIEPDRLRDEIDIALYRITQEALNNVAKHARARTVTVLLDGRADRISLIVEDDGVGFDAERSDDTLQRFGLIGMRERCGLLGGTLDIESLPGNGTTVVARIPQRTQKAT